MPLVEKLILSVTPICVDLEIAVAKSDEVMLSDLLLVGSVLFVKEFKEELKLVNAP